MTQEVAAAAVVEARRSGLTAYLLASLDGDTDRHFWLHRHELSDGRVIYLRPMLHGNVQLGVSPNARAQWFDDSWCYQDSDAAWRSALGWDGEGEPEGWYRHPQTGRRRPDGDPEREYIQP